MMKAMRSIRGHGRPAVGRVGQQLATALAALCAMGWLGGGSCHVSYCSEDCDPCFEHCACNTICSHSHATFQATHALTDYFLVEHPVSNGMVQRTFTEIAGLSIERAGGPAWPGDEHVLAFTRGLLAVNPSHLARRDAPVEFVLDSLFRYETAIVAQFHQDVPPGRENLVTFLLDPRGNLIEIDQALAR